MVWPTTPIPTANLDASTDSPAASRADLLQLAQQVNQLQAHVSAYAATLLDDADAATARATLGLYDSVFSFRTASVLNGVGASFSAVALDAAAVFKGVPATGNFVAPRSGHVRCSVGRMSYTVASGTVTGVSLRFSASGVFLSPEYFSNDNAKQVSAEAIFPCTAGQVFGVGCAAAGGGTANVALGGISFEMMD